jgi:hypothetical protein
MEPSQSSSCTSKDDKLKQAMLFTSISLAHQQLGQQLRNASSWRAKKQWDEAEKALDKSWEQVTAKVDLEDPKNGQFTSMCSESMGIA